MPYVLKLDSNGQPVLQEGKPVYTGPDGKEIALDADQMFGRITALNAEAATHRTAKETAETKLKLFAGIEDPTKALEALKVVSGMKENELIQAGERDAAVLAATKATEEKFKPYVEKSEKLEHQLGDLQRRAVFSGSKFIADKFQAKGPAAVDIAIALFGGNFKLEDGKLIAYGKDGNRLYSRSKPGQFAEGDEAVELLVENYEHRASILAGSGGSGSGTGPGAGGGGGGGRPQYTRAQFAALTPTEQQSVAGKAAKGEATIVD